MGSVVLGRGLLAVLLLLSLVIAPVAVATAAPAVGAADDGGASATTRLQPNNTTTPPQHRNPDAVGEGGDTDALTSWLARELGGSLADSTVRISQGEYERGRSLIGDEYDEYLAQYVDVAGETDSSVDDETGTQLGETKDTQREYADTVAEYEATYEAYQDARQAGEAERARELARELESLSSELSETGTALEADYVRLGELTGQDFSDARARIRSVTANVSERTAAVRAAEFTETRLSVAAASESVSFSNPLALEGQLTTTDGTALPETAVLAVGDQRRRVDLDADGTFALQYRPVALSTTATTLSVAYVPADRSVFRPANDSVAVRVTGETPTVALATPSEPVAYGDTVTLSGTASVDGEPVPNAPVVVTVDGREVGQARTDAAGRVTVRTTLGATPPAGEAPASLRVGEAGLAVGPGVANGSLTVRESETTLSLAADPDGDRLAVAGRLTTADGDAVSDQSVTLARNGTTVGTVTTDDQGRYSARVSVPGGDADSVALVARFDGTGTNLRRSSEELTVRGLATVGDGEGGEGSDGTGPGGAGPGDGAGGPSSVFPGESTASWVVVGGVGAVVAVVLLVWLLVGDPRSWLSADRAGQASSAVESTRGGGAGEPAVSKPTRLATRIDAAAADAADDPEAAVTRAYLDVRETLRPELGLSETATHSDFYRAVSAETPALQVPIGQLVGAFEVAAFAERSVTPTEAAVVLEDLRALFDGTADPRRDESP